MTPKAKILDDGTVMIYGVIGDDWDELDAKSVVEAIRGLGAIEELKVMINSPGGSVFDGLAIYHELATNPANVTIEITGVAASMASAIAMAGNHIRIAKNGHLMIHNPWNVAVGDADELRKAAEVLESFGTSLAGIYAERTGLSEEEVREMMNEETWLSAEEALAKGFVDEVIQPVEASAFADLDVSRLAGVPAALTRLIREGKAMTKQPKAPENTPEPTPTPVKPAADPLDPAAAASQAVATERKRVSDIEAMVERHGLPSTLRSELVASGVSLEDARARVLDELAKISDAGPSGIPSPIRFGESDREKFVAGAVAWLIQKSGRAHLFKDEKLEPGEFRGMSLLDLARESLHRAGMRTGGMSKMEVAGAALGRSIPSAHGAGLGGRSDFPVLLENVLHKMLLAAYGTVPDTWNRFCATGSVSDFRPHPRLRLGTFGKLDNLLESGEFKQKHFPDAEKESISADTKGNIVGLTRQAVVNDDVDGFTRLITMLGRAAGLSVEVDVYALLAENAGLGPNLSDGNPLFHDRGVGKNNIASTAALTVAALDADRVVLAQMKDPEGNEFLDLRPAVLVVPIALGGQARVINDAQYDTDGVDPGSDEQNKFMQPNRVRGLFRDIVDTPRLAGDRRYLFADPAVAPVIEVVYLDGQSTPVLETEEGFDYDGIRWRVRHDYGVAPTDFRGAITNAGG